jgi:hypothetical protein
MNLTEETADLRAGLRRLAAQADSQFVARYALRPLPTERPSAYRRARRAVGRLLRRFGLRPTVPPEPWLSGLKHATHADNPRTLLIWAVGAHHLFQTT